MNWAERSAALRPVIAADRAKARAVEGAAALKALAAARRDRTLAAGGARQRGVAAQEKVLREAEGMDCVYFMQCGAYVKIGRSTQLRARFRELQTGNPYPMEVLAVLPGGYALERSLRSKFAELLHRGEWFHLRGSLHEYITTIRKAAKLRPAAPVKGVTRSSGLI